MGPGMTPCHPTLIGPVGVIPWSARIGGGLGSPTAMRDRISSRRIRRAAFALSAWRPRATNWQSDDVDEIGFATFLASCLFFHDVHGGRERGSAIDGGRERPRCLLTNGRGDPLICLAFSFIFFHHSYGIRWRSGSESCAISRSVAPLTDLPALASADRAIVGIPSGLLSHSLSLSPVTFTSDASK